MGPAHGGVESMEGYLLGIDELAISGDEEEPAKLSLEDQSYVYSFGNLQIRDL